MAAKKAIKRALLARHGQTFAEELGIDVGKEKPTSLFQLLCAATLYSARIDSGIATQAARNLRRRGWRTSNALAESSWEERVAALNDAGYTRYQERTATMLGDLARHVRDRWRGDLRRLREEAERDPDRERRLLKEMKGMGDVGVDVFFREVQIAWEELAPFADRKALGAAKRLDLAADAKGLARIADGKEELTRLVTALVRTDLAGDYDDIRAAA